MALPAGFPVPRPGRHLPAEGCVDRTERFYKIDRSLRQQRVCTMAQLMEALDVSRATIKRDLEYLRDRFNAPIVWDRSLGGYRYDHDSAETEFQLPGLWLNASEVHALLVMDHLLKQMQPGLLGPHVGPLRERVRGLLAAGDHSVEEVERRIRVLSVGSRSLKLECFEAIANALLDRRRIRIRHFDRRQGDYHEREVSPLRLVHYRDNWYLDAWCHWRQGLRTFAVDAIGEAVLLATAAKSVSDTQLDAELGSGYGIFSGASVQQARLRFSPARARWVSREHWHPQQRGTITADGGFELEVPYSDDRELIMDIMRHGGEVEVLAPAGLRKRVRAELQRALAQYGQA